MANKEAKCPVCERSCAVVMSETVGDFYYHRDGSRCFVSVLGNKTIFTPEPMR